MRSRLETDSADTHERADWGGGGGGGGGESKKNTNLYGARHPTNTETKCKERAVDEADSAMTQLERQRLE
jgi:hypothetical protein